MPNKINTKTTSPTARKRTQRRVARRAVIFKPGGKTAQANAVIGNSLSAVKFHEKKGTEVFFNLQPEPLEKENFEKIFQDCWKAYANLHYLVRKEKLTFSLQDYDMETPTVFHYILTSFKKFLPKYFEFNIEEEDGNYFFVIYKNCAGWERAWHCLEVGPVLLHLKKENKALHDLFIIFLKAFLSNTGIDLWSEGLMGSTLDYMDDNLLNIEEEDRDPADIEIYKNDIKKYDSGICSQYARKIHNAKKMHPLQIQKRAFRFKKCNQVANLIYQGCELLLSKYNISEFRYNHNTEEEDGFYLDLDGQANIIWSYDDSLFHEHEQTLDSMANEGVREPVFSFRIDSSIKKIDFKKMEEKSDWPTHLSGYFTRAYKLINDFNDERDNRKIIKNL